MSCKPWYVQYWGMFSIMINIQSAVKFHKILLVIMNNGVLSVNIFNVNIQRRFEKFVFAFDDDSSLVQVKAWCCLATCHYLNQCWSSSMTLHLASLLEVNEFSTPAQLIHIQVTPIILIGIPCEMPWISYKCCRRMIPFYSVLAICITAMSSIGWWTISYMYITCRFICFKSSEHVCAIKHLILILLCCVHLEVHLPTEMS